MFVSCNNSPNCYRQSYCLMLSLYRLWLWKELGIESYPTVQYKFNRLKILHFVTFVTAFLSIACSTNGFDSLCYWTMLEIRAHFLLRRKMVYIYTVWFLRDAGSGFRVCEGLYQDLLLCSSSGQHLQSLYLQKGQVVSMTFLVRRKKEQEGFRHFLPE